MKVNCACAKSANSTPLYSTLFSLIPLQDRKGTTDNLHTQYKTPERRPNQNLVFRRLWRFCMFTFYNTIHNMYKFCLHIYESNNIVAFKLFRCLYFLVFDDHDWNSAFRSVHLHIIFCVDDCTGIVKIYYCPNRGFVKYVKIVDKRCELAYLTYLYYCLDRRKPYSSFDYILCQKPELNTACTFIIKRSLE